MRWPKYWSFSFSIISFKEHPGLIFRIDWLDLLAVQGTFKSLLQHHSSKASILRRSAFFTVQLSHPYMTTGKTIALTKQTFVGKVMSLLFNMLSRLVITFLPRSKCLLISWLKSPSAVILEPKKIKCKKDLHNRDNHDGVITHLEPDILECEVKWALESVTLNKASGVYGILVELFQILKDGAVKVLHSICQQIGKHSSGPGTRKGQFSFQSQRNTMPKDDQTTTQLHTSHILVK